MAHGQDQRPIEGRDSTAATVKPSSGGETVIYVSDPAVVENLARLVIAVESMNEKLDLLFGGSLKG
jgi:hypothetical protein